VTESTHTYTAVVGSNLPIPIRGGDIALDESRAPHVNAQLTIAFPSEATLAALDTRTSPPPRVRVSASEARSGLSRIFDLTLRERSADHAAATLTLSCASDEALLHDWAPPTEDREPLARQASARAVASYVIQRVFPGAVLAAGPDADLTRYWAVTNLLPNPSLETNIVGWGGGTGASGVDRIQMGNPVAVRGSYAIGWAAAAGDSNIIAAATPRDLAVTPGRWYVWSAYVVSSVARTARAVIQWWSANGTVLSSQSFGPTIATSTGEFRRVTVIAKAPPGVTHAYPYVNTLGNTGGELHYVDAAMFYEGDILVPYFDPTVAVPGYTVAWSRDAHASTSTRTPLIERPPEALIMAPGQSALEFLASVLQPAGLRPVCDENRVWSLRDETYSAAGSLSVRHGVNLVDGSDKVSREDETWFDAAITRYAWTDRDGQRQTAEDVYAPAGYTKMQTFERSTPYPGPGFSEYSVRRAKGRGREVSATAVADWSARAEQSITIILNAAPVQTGRTSNVTFDLDRDEMTITTRTVDTPLGAIDLLTGTINGLAGTINNL
jgi:hypothetical protein